MATDIAKFLRKICIDSDESLGDMADKIGLSAAYLSAIENDKRTAPEDMKENLYKELLLLFESVLNQSSKIVLRYLPVMGYIFSF